MSFGEGNLRYRVDYLERENAELRELARDLYDNLWTHVPKCADAFAERMRKLGIEVGR